MALKPVLVRDEDALVALLRSRREALGIPQQDLDCRIGWADGYTAKLESFGRSCGRRAAWGFTATLSWWLESLGLALVVMDKAQADALIADSTDPDIGQSVHQPYANRGRDRQLVQKRVVRFAYSFPRQAA